MSFDKQKYIKEVVLPYINNINIYGRNEYKMICKFYFNLFGKVETDYGCSMCMARVKNELLDFLKHYR